jgi:hypothetical protein
MECDNFLTVDKGVLKKGEILFWDSYYQPG